MDNIKMTWVSSDTIKVGHRSLPIRQVYVWLITDEERVVLVSKDGVNWQLPGGKPERGESIPETAVREVKEETGLDILNRKNDLIFFGYYVVEDNVTNEKIIQVRLYLKGNANIKVETMSLDFENTTQSERDMIRHINLSSVSDAIILIPWLNKSGEFKSLIELGIIND